MEQICLVAEEAACSDYREKCHAHSARASLIVQGPVTLRKDGLGAHRVVHIATGADLGVYLTREDKERAHAL